MLLGERSVAPSPQNASIFGVELFKDRRRSDKSIKRDAETTFGFLSRVDTPAFERVRQLLNEWFDHYEAEQGETEAKRLRSSFLSKRDHQFYDSFWELYLHEIHLCLGFSVRAHPETELSTRPDFELVRGAHRFYLEAVKPTPSEGFTGNVSPNGGQLIEYIDQVAADGYWLSVRFAAGGPELPRKRLVQAEVSKWLHGLDASDQTNLGSSTELRVGEWTIGLSAHVRRSKGPRRGSVGGFPGGGGFPDAMADALVPTLEDKSNRYGDLDAPYVLAVWVMSAMSSPETLPRALFGASLTVADGSYDLEARHAELAGSALWGRPSSRRRRVSAILAADSFRFNYSSVSRTLPRLWTNPWSDQPLTIDLPFPRSSVDPDFTRLNNEPSSVSAASLVGRPEDWPGDPFAA